MRKATFTKIASVLTMLAMLLTLTVAFAVGVSAEGTAQAQWGTDAANLTNEGTLQEALEAAADDSSITYIKVMNDTTLESALVANGGEFTLDLNGKKITYAGYVVNVYNSTIITITDTSAEQTGAIISTDDGASAICAYVGSSAQITVLSGELQGGYDAISLSSNASLSASTLTVKGGKLIGGQYAIAASGASVTVTGGTLVGKNADVFWKGGTLDLSNYANAANVTIANYTSADVTLPSENIKLPANYSFYDENDSRVDDVLASDSAYTIDVTKYQVTVNVNDNGSATTSAGDAWVAPGSEVTVNVVPNDGYRISEILVNDTPIVGNTFTMPEGDVIIDLTFRLYQAEWGTDKDNLTAWGTLQEALNAAASDANVKYIKVINNVDLGDAYMKATGGTFTLDLNGRTVTSTNYTLSLYNFVNITITDSGEGGKIETTKPIASAILVYDTSEINLTVEGGTLSSPGIVITAHSAFEGQVLTVNLTIKGGTLQTTVDKHIWWGSTGVLDLSDYANPTGITVNNFAGAEPNITLPAGYSFYDENGNRVDGAFENVLYIIDETKYKVTVNETANGVVTADQSGYLTPGTVVTLTLTPNEGYKADVTVDGATFDPETNTFTMDEEDVTVDVTFRPYQAEWGTDKDTLTEWGTLQEALNAAADENSTVGYIKVVSNMNSASLSATGGSFTLDLNGKTISSSAYTLVLKNSVNITIADSGEGGKLESIKTGYSAIMMGDNSAVVLTVTGGTIQATGNAIQLSDLISAQVNASLTVTGGTIIADTAILTNGSSVTIAGGDLQGSVQDILWYTGTLDFSGITGSQSITFFYQSTAQAIKLPESGYSLYEENSGERVTALSYSTTYVLDVTKYALDYSVDGATVTFAPEERYVLSETPVSFTVEPDALYKLISVTGKTASGTALEISYNEESGTYSFAMPEDDVTVTVKAKYAPFVWGNTSDAMTNTGDFFDLVAAINAGEAPYAKLLADYEVELSESDVAVSGKSFIDLNGHLLEFYAPNASKVVLGEGADITLFVEQKVDGVNTYDYDVRGAFELQSGSKLTVSGAYLIGYIFYNGGTLDISDAHLATYCELHNLTDAEITIADVVTFAAPFRAFDPAWYNDPNYEGYTVPTVTTLAARVENIAFAYIEAVFTVTFDFGKGSGTMPTVEVSSGDFGRDIPTPEGLSHPEGLALIGWTYEGKDYDCIFANSFYAPELADITLTAKWGAPLYVGGVGMNDGDYLASGATETTTKRPTTGGYAYYKNGVLTLNNYQFTGEGFAYEYDGYYDEKYFALIYSTTDLVIELVGSSNFVGTAIFYDEDHDYYFNADTDGVRVKGDLTVRGKGSLNIKVEDDGFYIEDLIFESGTVTIVSNDEAIESDSITVLDGALITVSEDGVDSKNVTVKGGEFYLLPEDDDDDVELDTQTLTVTGGKLVVKGYYGIYADYVTISGGVVEVEVEESGAITPCDEDNKDGFVTISGGKVTLYSEYNIAIYSTGDVTVSGGEVTLYGEYGIYADGNVTVTGGELEIEAYNDSIYAEGDVTISDGDIYTYSYSYNGISAYGNITISGGDVVISVGGDYAIEACGNETAVTINGGSIHLMGHICVTETTTVTFGGKATQIFIEGDIISTIPPVFTEGEIKHIFTVDGTSYYEGVEISHNWTDAYKTDETHHYRICTDEDCVVRYFYLPESYYQYFEDANYGEHTILEGETACSVCGYGAEMPEEEIPEDAVLLVGDHYLKIGEYLTFDSDGNPIVVTEKPATGGYLYVTLDTTGDIPIVNIVLSNFSFEYTGVAAIVALQDNAYIMQLEGENTITAHADKNYSALYPDALVNGAGIGAMGSQLVIVGEGSLTINAEVGIFGFDSSFAVQNGATVTINAQQDGIEIQNGIFAVADATLTVNAGDDGIYISNGRVILAAASRVSVTSGDEGFLLDNVTFRATNATVTVVAGDDAVDVDDCYIEWENSTFDFTADDHGITVYTDSEGEYAFLVTDSILNIEAGDDGIRIYGYPEVFFAGSVLNITAEDAGLYFDSTRVMFASQLGMILSLNSTPGTSGNVSEVNINAKRNYLSGVTVDVYEVKLNVVVTETAFALDHASLYFVGSEVSIVSRDMGIYSEYEAYVNVYDSTLSIEAARYGINGYLYLDIRGEMVDISVRAFHAIYCDSISLDEDYDYKMNAYCDGATFWDENDDIASYVTIRGYGAVNVEMEKAIENLDQLISEGGEFESIANSIADVNGLLDTLTNAEGEGRLDLIEKANEAINAALATLDQNLANAQTNLQNAIDTKADAETVNQSISDLNKALDDAEAAYAAADKAMDDKLTAAQTTLDTAIQAVDKKVDDAKVALEAAIAAGDATLTTEVENLNKALNDAEAAYAAADKALDDKLVAAQTTLDTAIQAVDKKVDDAKIALEAAIAAGDATLTTEVENLNKALNDAEAAYAAADKALDDKLVAAQTTLDTAIQAVDKKVDDAKTALEAAIQAGNDTLSAEIETLNTALENAEAAYAAADQAISDELTAAQTTLNTAIQTVDKKLEDAKVALDQAIADGDAELAQKIVDLNKALSDAEAANNTADDEIKAELSGKIEVAQATLQAAVTALQTALNSAKVEMQQQSSNGDAELRSEIAALKAELIEADKKSTPMQTATTVIAIVGLVCNAGLIAVLVTIESQKKILTPVLKGGFDKVASKFKKSGAKGKSSKDE